jgi:hypothetical protein
MTQNHKAIEQPERYRRQHEEVDCRDAIDSDHAATPTQAAANCSAETWAASDSKPDGDFRSRL